MTERPIQELIGERAIQAFAEFARADLESPEALAKGKFSHVKEPRLRQALSQVLYGTRWIYKLGLVMLTQNEERAAHVRAQIVDYASICEAVLSYCVGYALDNGHATGTAHHWQNPDEADLGKRKPIRWGKVSTETILRRQTFWWHSRICQEFGIITQSLFGQLDWLREQRNAVHVRQRVTIGASAYLNESKRAYGVLGETIRQTKLWAAGHP